MKLSTPSPDRRRSGTAMPFGGVRSIPPGSASSSRCSAASPRSPLKVRLAAQPVEQVPAPLGQVEDARGQAVGVQAEPQHVHRRLEQVGRDAVDRPGGCWRHEVPRRSTTSAGNGSWRRAPGPAPSGRRPWRGRPGAPRSRGVAGGEQQRVALPQRHLEVLGQVQHHLPAGPGPAGLHEAQVPGGDTRLLGQVELAEAAALAPLAEQLAHGVPLLPAVLVTATTLATTVRAVAYLEVIDPPHGRATVAAMTTTAPPPLPRPSAPADSSAPPSRLDAVVTGANGAAYLLGASLLDGPLGLSPGLLRGVGAFLLVYAAAVWPSHPAGPSPAPPSRRSSSRTCSGPPAASPPPSSASARSPPSAPPGWSCRPPSSPASPPPSSPACAA